MGKPGPVLLMISQRGWPPALDFFLGLAASLLLVLALSAWGPAPVVWVAGAVAVYIMLATIIYGCWTTRRHRTGQRDDFGWANRVTLVRVVLVSNLAGALLAPEFIRYNGILLASLALTAIALDGLDGWIARVNDSTSRFGARFDMEIDALLILVLSIAVLLADRAGLWVLAIGSIRYAFILASGLLPWLRGDLPPSTWRKAVCVTQGIVLAAALLPWPAEVPVQSALGAALAALIHSSSRDILWLWRDSDSERKQLRAEF